MSPKILLYYPSNFLSRVEISPLLNRFGPGQGHRLCQCSQGELRQAGEHPGVPSEQEGAEVSHPAAIPAVPQAADAQTPASEALLTGFTSSRAASPPSKRALVASRFGMAPALPPSRIPTEMP